MTFLFPGLVLRKAFVGQAREAEPRGRDTDAPAVIGKHFGSDVDKRPLSLGHHLSGPLTTVGEDELMDTLSRNGIGQLQASLRLSQERAVYGSVEVNCGVNRPD